LHYGQEKGILNKLEWISMKVLYQINSHIYLNTLTYSRLFPTTTSSSTSFLVIEATGLLWQYMWSYHNSRRRDNVDYMRKATIERDLPVKSRVDNNKSLHHKLKNIDLRDNDALPDSMLYLNEEMMQLFYQCAIQLKGRLV